MTDADYPMVIIGSGIAGLTAAVYAGRANNDPLVLRGDEPGGQLTLTSEVENYPGFPDGISGPELVNKMEEQAEQFGVEFDHAIVDDIDDEKRPFTIKTNTGEEITTDSVLVASGSSARTLGIPGEDELMGFGVSTCATCDGAFFRGEDMVVVGGGDAAFEEAHFLTKFADTVYLVHRREGFRAEAHWQEKVQKKVDEGDIEILQNTELLSIEGNETDGVDYAHAVRHPEGYPADKYKDGEDVEELELDVGAVFVAIGHIPNTSYLEDTGVELDEEGYVKTISTEGGGQTKTDLTGIFAAGDVVDHHYQQAVTAAGMGCKAAMDADDYLSD